MKLVSFQINNYKIVGETGSVNVDSRVTALVGKNECGKTAVLKALWKSSNVADVSFDKLYDYPRDSYAKDRKHTQEITALELSLAPSEVSELIATDARLVAEEDISLTYTTFFDGEDRLRRDIRIRGLDSAVANRDVTLAVEGLARVLAEQVDDGHDSLRSAATAVLGRLAESVSLWNPETVRALESLSEEASTWLDMNPERTDLAGDELERLSEILFHAKQGDPLDAARTWVESHLPIFIYFDTYGLLETKIHLPTYLSNAECSQPRMRTQAALFEWSNLDPKEILELGRPRQSDETEEQVHRRLEKRRALLDAASFALTGNWVQWWTDRRHKMHFDADGESLVLKISDEYNEFPIPFEERSHGFQWFFSFCLVFLAESAKTHKGAILLLDEPGLHLHPTLQTRLISLFERISDENQLLYSTHLPFLVDSRHLERVRTVHLEGPKPQRTKVSGDISASGDWDTLFPIQAALGYAIAQSLFGAEWSVVVENLADYWFVRALSNLLSKEDERAGVDEKSVFVPAGGIARLVPLAATMCAASTCDERRLIVLLGGDSLQEKTAAEVYSALGVGAVVLVLGEVIDVAHATIEDLVPRDVYASAFVERGYEFAMDDSEMQAATNVKAMEMVFERRSFGTFGEAERAAAVLALLDFWNADPSVVPEFTQKRGRALFAAINSSFHADHG